MAKEPQPAKGEAKTAGPPVQLRERYSILPSAPLDLGTPSAKAFVAEDRRDPARPLYALVCRPDMPARVSVMRALKGQQNVGYQQLVEWGPVEWGDRTCMAVIYERPLGGRVMPSLTAEIRRIDEFDIIRKVVTPLVAAVKDLTAKGVTHRAIRPTNMFYADADRERIVFGDCVTSPPGMDQPLVFETIESGMALPAGRGSGSYSNDLYSLGASLVMLQLGRNPVSHLSDQELLRRKITEGSYATLVGDERLPISMIEVLRGLLCDDPDERWSLESLDLWLSGRRLSPLQTKLEKKAARGFPFNGTEYMTARELAVAFAANWDMAMPLVLEGKLELWLRRALDAKEKANGIAAAVRNATAMPDKRAGMDAMMAKVCMVMDPAAPVRYKSFAAMPDGFGPMLALMVAEGADLRLFAEVILRDIARMWFEDRLQYNPEHSMLDGMFKDQRAFLTQTAVGFGIERCLYELNEALACQSPLIAEYHVGDVKEVLPALDKAAKKADPKSWPLDRHVGAFIAAHVSFDIDRQLAALNDPAPDRSALGMLNLLAVLQWRAGPESVLNLASWVGGLMGPIITSYHNRERRRALEREIPRLVRKGSLIELYNTIDNAEERQRDEDGFARARAEYLAAENEMRELEGGRTGRDRTAMRLGQQTAALCSVLIALFTVSAMILSRAW